MNIAEIKAKLPEAEVYEIDLNSRYIILVDRRQVSMDKVQSCADGFGKLGVHGVFVFVDDPLSAMKILEVKD